VSRWPYVFGVLLGVALGLAVQGERAAWWALGAACVVFLVGLWVTIARVVREGDDGQR